MERASVRDFMVDSFARSCKAGIRQGAGETGSMATFAGILSAAQGNPP
jgi:hypothetical protein